MFKTLNSFSYITIGLKFLPSKGNNMALVQIL